MLAASIGISLKHYGFITDPWLMQFEHAPEKTEQILRLISRTQIGRQILEEFLPAFHRGRVTIEGYPPEIIEKLRSVLGPGQPIGACFTTDGEHGTIYIDSSSPIGVLAPFLLHEMVHSLDQALWENASVPLTRTSRDELQLRAETKAFESQHRFVQELTDVYPEYRKFLVEQYPRARVLVEKLTEPDISELYGFDFQKPLKTGS